MFDLEAGRLWQTPRHREKGLPAGLVRLGAGEATLVRPQVSESRYGETLEETLQQPRRLTVSKVLPNFLRLHDFCMS